MRAKIVLLVGVSSVIPFVVLHPSPVSSQPTDKAAKIDHLALATKYREEQKWQQARNEYNEIIQTDPNVWRHYISRGFIELHLKNYVAALDNAQHASALTNFNGAMGLIALLRARAYEGMHKTDESIKQYLEATQRMPNNMEAQFELGKIFYRQKKYDEAYICLSKAHAQFVDVKKDKRIIQLARESETMLENIREKLSSAKKKNKRKKSDAD
ncbi:MAG: tetratricopeptide repeat protein [Candidatus Obscuribacterales bacterium]|jgi:Tfp pilus assembly protein PilF|nr:tetratricopeptide repeat protein [Candidatus Obscuribacterales bacterium]